MHCWAICCHTLARHSAHLSFPPKGASRQQEFSLRGWLDWCERWAACAMMLLLRAQYSPREVFQACFRRCLDSLFDNKGADLKGCLPDNTKKAPNFLTSQALSQQNEIYLKRHPAGDILSLSRSQIQFSAKLKSKRPQICVFFFEADACVYVCAWLGCKHKLCPVCAADILLSKAAATIKVQFMALAQPALSYSHSFFSRANSFQSKAARTHHWNRRKFLVLIHAAENWLEISAWKMQLNERHLWWADIDPPDIWCST